MSRARMLVLALLGALLLSGSSAMAQESSFLGLNEVSLQGTGVFTKDSQGNGINQHSTNTGGFLIRYRYHMYKWLSADASYGYARNTQQNLTSAGAFDVQATVHQATGALVVNSPVSFFRLKPYVLPGSRELGFKPTGNFGQ